MTGALGTLGMTRLPGPVRGALGRRREGVVVLPPTAVSVYAVSVYAVSVTPAAAVPRGPSRTGRSSRTGRPAMPGLSTLTTVSTPRSLWRRGRPLSQHGATLASLGRARREREESQAANGHQKSVFP
ncbi:hypothetical protein SRB17_32290 [Streptomyces sp. RB17]|nr:hypothetical protein [Streptomyces sp. RB17]